MSLTLKQDLMSRYKIYFQRKNCNEIEEYNERAIVNFRVFQLLNDSIHITNNLKVLYRDKDITDKIIKNMKFDEY